MNIQTGINDMEARNTDDMRNTWQQGISSS